MVHGQCFLNIQLHQYENIYNVEIRPDLTDPFCCCDQNRCQSNLDEISKKSCDRDQLCDSYFEASMLESQNFETWPTMFRSEVFEDSSTRTDVNYTFYFLLSKVPSELVCVNMRKYALHYQNITGLNSIIK